MASLTNYFTSTSPLEQNLSHEYRRRFLWHGFFLCTLAFLIAPFLPLYTNPRAGLATHLIGITTGILLMAVGLAFPYLSLSEFLAQVIFWLLVPSFYIGFACQFLGALFGLTKMFPITGEGFTGGAAWMEIVVSIATKGITVTTILGCIIIIYGLRRVNKV